MIWFRTVPEYIDRSDDVAWMLGCSLILLTIQVREVLLPKIEAKIMEASLVKKLDHFEDMNVFSLRPALG